MAMILLAVENLDNYQLTYPTIFQIFMFTSMQWRIYCFGIQHVVVFLLIIAVSVLILMFVTLSLIIRPV